MATFHKEAMSGLLKKAAVFRFLQNFNRTLGQQDLNMTEVSRLAGRADNAFNKALNQVKDLRISTVLSYVSFINRELAQSNKPRLSLDALIDDEIERLLLAAGDLKVEDLGYWIGQEKLLLQGLKSLQMTSGFIKSLTREEKHVFTMFIAAQQGEGV